MRKLIWILLLVVVIGGLFITKGYFYRYKNETKASTADLVASGIYSSIVSSYVELDDYSLIGFCSISFKQGEGYKLMGFLGVPSVNSSRKYCNKRGISSLFQVCPFCLPPEDIKWLCPDCGAVLDQYKFSLLINVDENYYLYSFGSQKHITRRLLSKSEVERLKQETISP